jgi:hypothetical protein
VQLTGGVGAFRADHVLHPRQLEEVAQLGGVDGVGGGDGHLAAVAQVPQGDRVDLVTAGVRGDRYVLGEHRDLPGCPPRREHLVQHGGGHPRFVAEPADDAQARVE